MKTPSHNKSGGLLKYYALAPPPPQFDGLSPGPLPWGDAQACVKLIEFAVLLLTSITSMEGVVYSILLNKNEHI